MARLTEVDAKLDQLLALPEGWDRYGSERVSPAAVEAIRKMMVSPTPLGGVAMEWTLPNAALTIEFGSDGHVESVVWFRTEGEGIGGENGEK